MPSIWDDRLAEVWAAPGKAGAGVVVGRSAVLTARHVVEGALSSGEIFARRVKPVSLVGDWVPMTVLAEDEEWDLAVLSVSNDATSAVLWTEPTSAQPVLARLGTSSEPGCEAVGFPQSQIQQSSPDGDVTIRQTEQVYGTLLPAGQAREPLAPDRTLPRRWLPFDVETATPGTADGWGGMSGAGVILPSARLVGIVVAADSASQQRRLYVVPLAEALAGSSSVADALRGASNSEIVIESPQATRNRAILEDGCLGSDGLPLRVGEANLDAFGVKPAEITGEPPFLEYVQRDYDNDLQTDIERARAAQQMLLVVGGSAGGKSRSAAEAARQLLGDHRLLCPRSAALAKLADLDRNELGQSVVWLDDVERYDELAFKDSITRLLGEGVVVIGTIRRSVLEARMPKGDLRNPMGDALMNANIVRQVPWATRWTEDELGRVEEHVTNASLLRWVTAGNSPSAWVVAGPALLGKLRLAEGDDDRPARFALVRGVLDWYRTGIEHPVPKATATGFVPLYVVGEVRSADLEDGFRWALEPVMGDSHRTAQALLSLDDGESLTVHDYIQDVDNQIADQSVPAEVWTAAIGSATSDDQLFAVGLSAAYEGNLGVGQNTWIPLAEAGDTGAMANLLLVLKDSDPGEARRWGEAAAQAGDVSAMFNLGYLLADSEPDESRRWYEAAATAGHLGAMINLGVLLRETDPVAARRWYEQAVEGGSVDAMNNLGFMLKDSEPDEARRLWEHAAEAGSPEAMTSLGLLLVGTDPDAARLLWERAADQGHLGAMFNLGLLLSDMGDLDQARMWLERAAQAGSSEALTRLGILQVETQPEQTRTLWTSAAAAGDVSAMYNLWLLLKDSEPDEARNWLETAASAGSTIAMYALGSLLRDADPHDAATWLRRAAEAGSMEAMIGLGLLLETTDAEEAVTWLRTAADRGSVDAMVALGLSFKDTQPDQARAWLETAANAGSRVAMHNLAVLLKTSDPDAARVWRERADQSEQ